LTCCGISFSLPAAQHTSNQQHFDQAFAANTAVLPAWVLTTSTQRCSCTHRWRKLHPGTGCKQFDVPLYSADRDEVTTLHAQEGFLRCIHRRRRRQLRRATSGPSTSASVAMNYIIASFERWLLSEEALTLRRRTEL
jgi:hypothetical protein